MGTETTNGLKRGGFVTNNIGKGHGWGRNPPRKKHRDALIIGIAVKGL